MAEVIRVVGAVFVREGQFLAFRRKEGKSMAGFWEFPGGKIESGETPAEAMVREIEEELGTTIQVGQLVTTTVHEYDFATIELTTFECESDQREFTSSDHDSMQWVDAHGADELEWAPADVPAVEIMKQRVLGES